MYGKYWYYYATQCNHIAMVVPEPDLHCCLWSPSKAQCQSALCTVYCTTVLLLTPPPGPEIELFLLKLIDLLGQYSSGH